MSNGDVGYIEQTKATKINIQREVQSDKLQRGELLTTKIQVNGSGDFPQLVFGHHFVGPSVGCGDPNYVHHNVIFVAPGGFHAHFDAV